MGKNRINNFLVFIKENFDNVDVFKKIFNINNDDIDDILIELDDNYIKYELSYGHSKNDDYIYDYIISNDFIHPTIYISTNLGDINDIKYLDIIKQTYISLIKYLSKLNYRYELTIGIKKIIANDLNKIKMLKDDKSEIIRTFYDDFELLHPLIKLKLYSNNKVKVEYSDLLKYYSDEPNVDHTIGIDIIDLINDYTDYFHVFNKFNSNERYYNINILSHLIDDIIFSEFCDILGIKKCDDIDELLYNLNKSKYNISLIEEVEVILNELLKKHYMFIIKKSLDNNLSDYIISNTNNIYVFNISEDIFNKYLTNNHEFNKHSLDVYTISYIMKDFTIDNSILEHIPNLQDIDKELINELNNKLLNLIKKI